MEAPRKYLWCYREATRYLQVVKEDTEFKRRAAAIEKNRVEIAALNERIKRLIQKRGVVSGANADALGKIFNDWLRSQD